MSDIRSLPNAIDHFDALRQAIGSLPVTDVSLNHGLLNDQLRITFENGYGLSVITGDFSYSDGITFEIAVINPSGRLDYTTPITDDVIPYADMDDLVEIMKQAADL